MTLAGTAAFAFGAGLAAFAAPCALPLLPGYVGYFASQYGDETARAPVGATLARGLAAAAGVLGVFAVLAAAVFGVGRPAGLALGRVEPFVGVALVALGAATVTGRAPSVTVRLPRRRRSVLGFAVFGGLYAVAAAGCTVPVFLAVLARALSLPPTGGGLTLAAYALGLALPLVGVTLALGRGLDIAIGRLLAYGTALERAAGLLLLAAGLTHLWLVWTG